MIDGSGTRGGEGAFVKGKEEELEVGKPSEEERRGAAEKNGGEIEREVEEEEYGGEDDEESGGAGRSEVADGVTVG